MWEKTDTFRHFMQSLSLEQTEELHDDIERYLQLEEADVNIEFWTVRAIILPEEFHT